MVTTLAPAETLSVRAATGRTTAARWLLVASLLHRKEIISMPKIAATHHPDRNARQHPNTFATPARPARCARRCWWLLALTLWLAVVPAQAQWVDNQPAVNVIGQANFNSGIGNTGGRSASTLNNPRGVAVDPTSGKVYVLDFLNNRVLRFSSLAAMLNGQAAEGVLGQPGFTTSTGATGQNRLRSPGAVALDAEGRLWVADTNNHRVLRFDNAATKADGANADGVLGQLIFTTAATAASQSGMHSPLGVFVDAGGRLWVADTTNNRVLRFDNAAAKANGAPADGVLGQADFTSSTQGLTQSGMNGPIGMFVDGAGRLWVAEQNNNRVLRFDNAAAKSNGGMADGVLGQPNFTSNTATTSQNGMLSPYGVFGDPFGRLYVSEIFNNRVLLFDNAAALPNGANAANVLGQPDFTSNTENNGGISATSLSGPTHLFFDAASFSLYVADRFNSRVKRYTIPPPVWANNQPATNVLGQPDFSSKLANNGGRSATSLSNPSGVAVDPTSGKVFVSDTNNGRVLRYSSLAAMLNGQAAEGVLGQADFSSIVLAHTQNGMINPGGIAVDGAGRLWVTDVSNHRVLRFDNAASKANGANADGVLGQTDFTGNGRANTQSGLRLASGVFADAAGRLWVADTFNNRVLRFDNAASKANGANADGVLGQPDFTTDTPAASQSKMSSPVAVFADSAGCLWVAESANRRVLRFDDAASKANGAPADGVLGQPDFTTIALATTQSGLRQPFGVAGDPAGRLYVSDAASNRVLIFNNAAALPNGAPADNVLGQPDFSSSTSNNGGVSATSLAGPVELCFDAATYALYVADRNNHRVKRYKPLSCPNITLAALSDGAVGTSYASSATATPAGSYSYTVTAGALPPGLALYDTTGLLYGYPTAAGSFSFTITATAANNCTGTRGYTINISAQPCSAITLADLPTPTLNAAYNQTVTVTPAGSYSFAVTAGALPAGLALNAATGVVSGTPTAAGAYNFTLTATGAGNCTGSRSFSGAIAGGSCGITLAALPSGTVGQSYVNYATASPSGSYTYTVTAGALPPGLTLYVNGLVYGYPTAAGNYTFTITATAADGCTGLRSYTVGIN